MAVVVCSGFPCAGKSFRSNQIREFFQEKELQSGGSKQVVLLSENSHSLDIKRSAYDSSATEKPARGALLTAIIRLLSPSTILIVDAPNYIKGFRYQIYCAAREVKVRVATVSYILYHSPRSCILSVSVEQRLLSFVIILIFNFDAPKSHSKYLLIFFDDRNDSIPTPSKRVGAQGPSHTLIPFGVPLLPSLETGRAIY